MKKHATKIISITPYNCGSRTYSKADIPAHQKLILPEWAFRIEHRQLGNMLFNTGYSNFISPLNLKTQLFMYKHKIAYIPQDTLSAQFSAEGMDEQCIRRIILSHAALDSIGGLPQFSGYTLYGTAQSLAQLNNSLFSDYISKRLVPPKSIVRKPAALFSGKSTLSDYFPHIYDLFEDGSVLGISLNGYAKGHIGLYFPEHHVLLAAHACINSEQLSATPTKHFLKQQYNSEQYLDTLQRLRRFLSENSNIRCFFSNEAAIEHII